MSRSVPARKPVLRYALAVATALIALAAAAGSATHAAAAAGYTSLPGITYVAGGTSAQTLDLYLPTGTSRPRPVIVYVHGGGWSGGSSSELQGMAGWQSFLSAGFALASINYTSSSTRVFPQQIFDVKSAIRFLRANAARYGLSNRIGIWGGSAGGQLAALAGTSCGVASLEGDQGVRTGSSCVQAVVDVVGPTDFLQMDSHLLNSSAMQHNPASSPESRYLGCTEGLLACPVAVVQRANPITYISRSRVQPPFLIAHGDADSAVPHWESEILFTALSRACADVSFHSLKGQDHFMSFSGAFDPPYPAQTVSSSRRCGPVATAAGPPMSWARIAAFFRSHLG